MPPITLLRKAGVRVVAGSDNIRDAWSPFGNASMLERCWLIAYRSGYRTDEEIVSTFDLATANPASLLGLERHLAPGFSADLIALPARTLAQAIVERPHPDLVLHHAVVRLRPPRNDLVYAEFELVQLCCTVNRDGKRHADVLKRQRATIETA
jgi:cytosine deaminase